jgi:PAS domain S-box-containing protein
MELIESGLQGVARIDAQGRYLSMDHAFQETFGCRPAELLGAEWRSILQPQEERAALEAYEEMQAHGVAEFQALALTKQGARHRVRILLLKDQRQNSMFSGHFCFVLSPLDPNHRQLGIREGEQVFDAVLEDAPIGGVLVDASDGFRRVNRTLLKMLGYSKAELLGKNFADITDPESFERSSVLVHFLVHGVLPGHEVRKRMLRRDRQVIWVRLFLRVVRDTGGGPVYALGLIQELSGTARTEPGGAESPRHFAPKSRALVELGKPSLALQRAWEKPLRLFDSLPLAVAILELGERRYVFVSDGFLRLCGCSREEVLGARHHAVKFLLQARILDEILSGAGVSRGAWDEPCALRAPSGKETPGLLAAQLVQIEGTDHLVLAIQDLTGQKRACELLQESEDRYHAVAEQAWEGILLVDPASKRILEATRSLLQLLGYDRTEILHLTLYDLMAIEQEALDRDVAQVVGEQHRTAGDRPFRRKDGVVIDLEVSANTVSYRGAMSVRIVVRDTSQRRLLEQQLRHAVKMEALGQFAGGIAHDFNNLLVGILGYSTLLETRLQGNQALWRMAHEITSVALRARELTAQLLSMSRRQVAPAELLEVNAVVKAAEMLLRRIIGEDIELVCELHPEAGLVRANAGQIEQVIMNLAANSRDAMPAGGKLVIRTANVDLDHAHAHKTPELGAGRYVLLSVQDTGVGMDAATLSRVFEPFFTTKASGVGTGLGLSTVYGIVKQLGGHVSAESQPGRGATFSVYLPRAEEQGSLFQPAESGAASVPVQPAVLVVEDEKTVRSLVREILQEKGYQVLTAEKPEQALLLAREHEGPIDLFITDIVMPAMLGTNLAAEFVKLRPKARVLYMSGYSDAEIVRRTQLGESAFFLQKPFTPEEILRKVREVLSAGGDEHTLRRN